MLYPDQKRINAHLELLRVRSLLDVLIVYAIGTASTQGQIFFDYHILLGGAVLMFSLFSANILNDIYDIDVDLINQPTRPLAANLISLRTAIILFWIMIFGSFASGLALGFVGTFVSLLAIAIGVFYSHPRFAWARHGFWGTIALVIFYFAIPFAFGHYLATDTVSLSQPILLLYVSLGLFGFARVLLKDFKDLDGDTQNDKKTPLVLLGKKAIAGMAITSFLLSYLSVIRFMNTLETAQTTSLYIITTLIYGVVVTITAMLYQSTIKQKTTILTHAGNYISRIFLIYVLWLILAR